MRCGLKKPGYPPHSEDPARSATVRLVNPDIAPMIQQFLRGAQAWMAGRLEWHSTSRRYTNVPG